MVLKNEKDTKHQKELNNLEAMFKRATIPLLVLQMLSEREMYAYEIIQEVTSLTGGTYKMPLLYTPLNKLKEQGYIVECRQEITDKSRIRRYYAVTDKGLELLEDLKQTYTDLAKAVEIIIS